MKMKPWRALLRRFMSWSIDFTIRRKLKSYLIKFNYFLKNTATGKGSIKRCFSKISVKKELHFHKSNGVILPIIKILKKSYKTFSRVSLFQVLYVTKVTGQIAISGTVYDSTKLYVVPGVNVAAHQGFLQLPIRLALITSMFQKMIH